MSPLAGWDQEPPTLQEQAPGIDGLARGPPYLRAAEFPSPEGRGERWRSNRAGASLSALDVVAAYLGFSRDD